MGRERFANGVRPRAQEKTMKQTKDINKIIINAFKFNKLHIERMLLGKVSNILVLVHFHNTSRIATDNTFNEMLLERIRLAQRKIEQRRYTLLKNMETIAGKMLSAEQFNQVCTYEKLDGSIGVAQSNNIALENQKVLIRKAIDETINHYDKKSL